MRDAKNYRRANGPSPFDGSADTRLADIGVLDDIGEVNAEAMRVFARIFAGQFYHDLSDSNCGVDNMRTIHEVFNELIARENYNNMLIFLSVQYDRIGKTIPDPVYWLAGNEAAVRAFLNIFTERYDRLVSVIEAAPPVKGGDAE